MANCCVVTKTQSNKVVTVANPRKVASSIAKTGLPGPPGSPGSPGINGGTIIVSAGEVIVAYDPIYVFNNQAFIASNSDLVNFDKFVGLAESSGNIGEDIIIRTEGEIQNPSWNWTNNSFIWLSNNTLTENFPTITPSEYRQFVGRAISPVKIIVNISEPILYNV